MTSTSTANDDASSAQTGTGTATATEETVLVDLPPSAKLVYTVLRHEGPLTQGEIASESRLCPRTVRYALSKLETVDVVTSRVHLRDARKSVYQLVDS